MSFLRVFLLILFLGFILFSLFLHSWQTALLLVVSAVFLTVILALFLCSWRLVRDEQSERHDDP